MSDRRVGLVRFVNVIMLIMRRMRNLADVDHRQQSKHQRLHESNESAEKRQGKLSKRRIKVRDFVEDLFVSEHVREKSNSESERANQITDQLNAKNQRSYNDRDEDGQLWSGKMAEIFQNAVL